MLNAAMQPVEFKGEDMNKAERALMGLSSTFFAVAVVFAMTHMQAAQAGNTGGCVNECEGRTGCKSPSITNGGRSNCCSEGVVKSCGTVTVMHYMRDPRDPEGDGPCDYPQATCQYSSYCYAVSPAQTCP